MARLARITLALTLLGCLAAANVRAQGLAVAITGESNLRVTFMTQLREYAAEHKVPLEFV